MAPKRGTKGTEESEKVTLLGRRAPVFADSELFKSLKFV